MKIGKVLDTTESGVDAVIKLLSWCASIFVGIMALVVVGNVIGRSFFNKPLVGTLEIVELIMVVIAFFAMAYTAVEREHVRVDLVISRLSRRTKAILISISFFLSAGLFILITYQSSVFAIRYAQDLSKDTYILSVPLAIPEFVMALGFLMLCLKLLFHIFHPLPHEEVPKEG